MKKLFLIRHAKSSWADGSQADVERPLNKRGERDAPEMAKLLKDINQIPEGMLISTAVRARQTADYFLDKLDISENRIAYTSHLYHASPSAILDQIHRLDEHLNSMAIVGHNPGLTLLLSELIPEDAPDNMPTCGIAILESDAEYWATFETGEIEMKAYLYPKKDLPQFYG